MEASLYVFAVDLTDAGFGPVLDGVRERTTARSVSLAVSYHHARDVLPHNPVRKVYYHEGGTVVFRPDYSRYGELVPLENSLQLKRDVLGELCHTAEERSMAIRAWVVYLHNSRLGMAHQDCVPVNAFGDPQLTDLCPSNPQVRRYAVSLTEDICRYPITSILAEALHFKTFDHGYHHERTFLDLGPIARFLLGLCFCVSCRAGAEGMAVDAVGLQESVRAYLLGVFTAGGGGHGNVTTEALTERVGGEVEGYLAARNAAVTSLVEEVAEAAHAAGVRLTFSAHGGSAKGGSTQSSDSPDDAWILGVDLAEVARGADEFEILGYVKTPAELERLTAGYLDRIGPVEHAVGLRPMWPDTSDLASLTEKVRVARAGGAVRLDFYHYGLMPERSLDWIGAALTS